MYFLILLQYTLLKGAIMNFCMPMYNPEAAREEEMKEYALYCLYMSLSDNLERDFYENNSARSSLKDEIFTDITLILDPSIKTRKNEADIYLIIFCKSTIEQYKNKGLKLTKFRGFRAFISQLDYYKLMIAIEVDFKEYHDRKFPVKDLDVNSAIECFIHALNIFYDKNTRKKDRSVLNYAYFHIYICFIDKMDRIDPPTDSSNNSINKFDHMLCFLIDMKIHPYDCHIFEDLVEKTNENTIIDLNFYFLGLYNKYFSSPGDDIKSFVAEMDKKIIDFYVVTTVCKTFNLRVEFFNGFKELQKLHIIGLNNKTVLENKQIYQMLKTTYEIFVQIYALKNSKDEEEFITATNQLEIKKKVLYNIIKTMVKNKTQEINKKNIDETDEDDDFKVPKNPKSFSDEYKNATCDTSSIEDDKHQDIMIIENKLMDDKINVNAYLSDTIVIENCEQNDDVCDNEVDYEESTNNEIVNTVKLGNKINLVTKMRNNTTVPMTNKSYETLDSYQNTATSINSDINTNEPVSMAKFGNNKGAIPKTRRVRVEAPMICTNELANKKVSLSSDESQSGLLNSKSISSKMPTSNEDKSIRELNANFDIISIRQSKLDRKSKIPSKFKIDDSCANTVVTNPKKNDGNIWNVNVLHENRIIARKKFDNVEMAQCEVLKQIEHTIDKEQKVDMKDDGLIKDRLELSLNDYNRSKCTRNVQKNKQSKKLFNNRKDLKQSNKIKDLDTLDICKNDINIRASKETTKLVYDYAQMVLELRQAQNMLMKKQLQEDLELLSIQQAFKDKYLQKREADLSREQYLHLRDDLKRQQNWLSEQLKTFRLQLKEKHDDEYLQFYKNHTYL